MPIVNLSAYRFTALTDLPHWRRLFEEQCGELAVRGTVLLAEEGINLAIAGEAAQVTSFKSWLCDLQPFRGMVFKESVSENIPFEKFCVKIKPEIVTMRELSVDAVSHHGRDMAPQELKRWLDEGKDFTLLDTRNTFEYEYGAFENAIHLDIENFSQFPEASDGLPDAASKKPLVMYCTGGIRCEKASLFLEQQGFEEVYQLQGGIINYFRDCGKDHYRGDCFVFDEREVIQPEDITA